MFLHTLDNHIKHKNNLLTLIDKIEKDDDIKFGSDSLHKSDFYLDLKLKKEYLNYFYKIIDPIMLKLCDKLSCVNYTIHNAWFQQYKKNNFHGWHTHTQTQFSNIYFLQLPNTELSTEFFNYEKPDIKEGDVFTFPSYVFHRSPINKTNKQKTVIAFNSCFYNFKK
tara:strand:- start:837 stop:1334 length:498 start_codon:yes stop_codon:yes gene_type:complete